MQSNNNYELMAVIAVFVVIVFVIQTILIIALAVGILLAAFMTGVCLFAWNRPVEIGGETITPEGARAFIGGGVFSAIGAIAVALTANALGLDLSPDMMPLAGVIGYIVGSFGAVHELEQEAQKARAATEAQPTQEILPPQPVRPAEPRPFTFADWDDEEERQ